MKEIIAVWFSCGAASAVAAKKTLEKYGKTHNVRVLNNPVAEEDEDNRRFLADVELWLGVEIESVINPKYPNASAFEVWNKRKYMAGIGGAPCTLELKKEARYHWEKTNKADWHVLGFTLDEWDRARRFKANEKDNLIPILVHEMLTKDDCFRIIRDAGIELPRVYKHIPNANCIGCVKSGSPAYWLKIKEVWPDVWEQRVKQSREIGARLVVYKGKRIFLDELPDDAKVRPMKNLDFECGIFCEER